MTEVRNEIITGCESHLKAQIEAIIQNLSEGETSENKLSPEQIQEVVDRFTHSFRDHFSQGFNHVFRNEISPPSSSENAAAPSPHDLTITDEDLTQVDDAMTHLVARRQKYPQKISLYAAKTLEHNISSAKNIKVDVDFEDLPKEPIALDKEGLRRHLAPAELFGQDDASLMVRVKAECDRADYISNALAVVENSQMLMQKLS